MFKKNIYLRITIWMGLFVFLTFLFPANTFAYQNYDLDEFDDLELKSQNEQKKISDKKNDKQRLILFDDNLYLLDDDFDLGEEELELLKLELNPDDIELSREYEEFLNAFFEQSKLVRPRFFEESNSPIIKQEKPNPSTKNKIEAITPKDPRSFEQSNLPIVKQEKSIPSIKNKIEDITPIDSSSFKKSNSPIIKHKKTNPSTKNIFDNFAPVDPSSLEESVPAKNETVRGQKKTSIESLKIKNQLSILPKIGFGMSHVTSYNILGFIAGGSISYGNNKLGNLGVDLTYIIIKNEDRRHTMGITGFYERIILKFIALKGGLSYLKTGYDKNIAMAVGAGVSYPIGNMLIFKPMININFGSKTNNIMGINLNIGISLEM